MKNDKEILRRLNREHEIAGGDPVNYKGKRIKVEKSEFHKALEHLILLKDLEWHVRKTK